MARAEPPPASYRYDDADVDRLLRLVWGDSISFGIYDDAAEPIEVATARTRARMALPLSLEPRQTVLEVACGFATTARFLAREYGCRVTATNLSERQLESARAATEADGLSSLIAFEAADYHALPFADATFDVWWCQDAVVHSGDKGRVIAEAHRVLKPGGYAVLTEQLMRHGTMSTAERARFAERYDTEQLWDEGEYVGAFAEAGFRLNAVEDWTPHLARHSLKLCHRAERLIAETNLELDPTVVEKSLGSWRLKVEQAAVGKLGWGFFLAQALSRSDANRRH
ncbi:MAG: methyltransferase domain-containing protein [Alphaproteobacteria bacterium]|jgi:sarcosine/dimethylglycine N-methyltransferase|nr:methyltransferase domain-containing protein [Alphaproteobacteria bacterium]